jgi:hypothetical protein
VAGLVPATLGRGPLGNERLFLCAPLFHLFYQVEIRQLRPPKTNRPLGESSNAATLQCHYGISIVALNASETHRQPGISLPLVAMDLAIFAGSPRPTAMPQTPAPRARWASASARRSPSPSPTAQSSTSRATPRSALRAWRWRRCATTISRSRSSS